MTNSPSRFALHAMYNSFIKKWGTEYAPEFKEAEALWVELTNNLNDAQIRQMSSMIIKDMTGFPGTVHIKKYVEAVINNTQIEPSSEEKIAMDIISYVCKKYPEKEQMYRVSDALEIAASIFYIYGHGDLETDTETISEAHIIPRKRMFLTESFKWVMDAYEKTGNWLTTINKIKKTYDA